MSDLIVTIVDAIEPTTCGIDEAVDKHLGNDADAFYELIIKGLDVGIDEGVPGGDKSVINGVIEGG